MTYGWDDELEQAFQREFIEALRKMVPAKSITGRNGTSFN
jgi:hypothetical protein